MRAKDPWEKETALLTPLLLTRDEFRNGVFTRDGHQCVFCGKPAQDAHHIIERRLWPDGGYYLENGASVCAEHHLACEMTHIAVEEVRAACGITHVVLPPHLYADHQYDKWGNPLLSNGQRLKGELFDDASVQKMLAQGGVLDQFTHWVKYPRTHHVPWSPGIHEDDRVIASMAAFEGQRVIVTEKKDGENTTLYCDHMHARSVESGDHASRHWVKNFWSGMRAEIPKGWRVCGENLFAKHSIHYADLESYFLGFSVWNEANMCLAWHETLEWFALLGIMPVPVLYHGLYDEQAIRALYQEKEWASREGYVLRIAEAFSYGEFRKKVAKFVRKGHVQTIQHWLYGRESCERNALRRA